MMRIGTVLFGVAAIAIALWSVVGSQSPVALGSGAAAIPDAFLPPTPLSLRQIPIESEPGWDIDVATKVDDVFGSWMMEYCKASPTDAARQCKLIADLGKHPAVLTLLRSRPETAGLLAGLREPLSAARVLANS